MALPKVEIQIQNGGLGRVADQADFVCALVLGGVAATSLAQNVAARMFSVAGAESLGITSATHAHAYTQISDFFAQAGTGAALWIMLVPDTTTAAAIVADNGPLDKLLQGANGEVTLAGWSIKRAVGYTPGTNWFDYDIAAVAAQCQTVATRYANSFMPVRIIMDGSYLNATKMNAGDALPTLKGIGERVAVFVGASTLADRHACMGRLFGWYAAGQVHDSPGKVKREAFLGTGYLTTGAAVTGYVTSQIQTLHDAGIMALRTYVGKGGVYITSDPSFAAVNSDFEKLSRGLVMDKARRLTYITYVEEINDTIEITGEGKMSPTKVSYLEDRIENTLNLSMVTEGNISSVRCVIDPSQDILANDRIYIDLYIVPLGIIEEIIVKLGFENPAQAA